MTLEATLISVYSSFGESVDRIASSAELRSAFRSRLPQEFQSLIDDELVRRLINLRKRSKLPSRKVTEV